VARLKESFILPIFRIKLAIHELGLQKYWSKSCKYGIATLTHARASSEAVKSGHLPGLDRPSRHANAVFPEKYQLCKHRGGLLQKTGV
jgi:hypothetical protein